MAVRRIVWPDCRREGWYYICAGPPDRAQYRRDRRRVHVDFLCVYVYTRPRVRLHREHRSPSLSVVYTLTGLLSYTPILLSFSLSVLLAFCLHLLHIRSSLSVSRSLFFSFLLSLFLSLSLCLSFSVRLSLSFFFSLPLTLLALAQSFHSMRIPPCYSPRCFARDRAHCYSSRSARHV